MTQALPILTQLHEWMQQEYPKVLPQSPIGKAIGYALPLMESMRLYALHGNLQIDNNLVENAIRPIAPGRRNYLFADTKKFIDMKNKVRFRNTERLPACNSLSVLAI
jgi:transposase